MKTPEEIKKGLECGLCHECPYDSTELETVEECARQVHKDAIAYIQQLEDAIDKTTQVMQSATEVIKKNQEQIESTYSQVRKALCGKENATICEVLDAVSQVKSRLAQAERERDAAINELPHHCWNCKYHRDTPIEEIDTGGLTIHRYCDADYCYPDEENSSWKWRGVCPENSKEGWQ